MTEQTLAWKKASFGATERRDLWWVAPLATALGLGAFVVYSTWAAFQGAYYSWGPYLSPFYSPSLPDFLFPPFWPDLLPRSPAFLILWAPAGFRFTCYYYRKAYYRAYFSDPPACAVGEARHGYRGETSFPFILQNIHRYFFYIAAVFIGILAYDAAKAFFFQDGFGAGVGSLVLTANASLLGLYTFSCHSFRHLIGGKEDCYSSCAFGGAKHKVWSLVSRLNTRHMLWAWMSLFMVGFADLYVRLVAMGVWTDVRIF